MSRYRALADGRADRARADCATPPACPVGLHPVAILRRVKIAICVKEVPDPTAQKRIDPGTGRLVRAGENTINPYDRHAIEEAVRLKEAGPDAEIAIVLMGPASASRTVDKALAQGGDRSVHLADDALAGSTSRHRDGARRAAAARGVRPRPLRAAGRRLRVLRHGRRRRRAAAAALRHAGRRAHRRRASALTVKRQVETGYDTISVPLPAVLSVSDAINEPRYPSLPAIMGAKRKPHEVLALADAGIDAERRRRRPGRRPPSRACRRRRRAATA